MKFRLKTGHLFGSLNPESNNGRKYGMYMVPWIKSVKETLDIGLKEAKSLADYLRDSVESGNGDFHNATVDVDIVQFPFLEHFVHLPQDESPYIELIREYEEPGLACTVGPIRDGRPTQIIKDAMCKLIELNAWNDVRRLAEVLMDIEDEQSV